ncbi:hypothetical protein AK830_g8279 [Neonectria ditissima]|uniref:Asl1-like glycosyl hydrolase catalytic domain-containing protein n=1 Tax=Neonectria ditissima TaxID=78410 RepID=A0A0P7AUV6_9HYPO|nr:hypothetical protein AK830_g8279 [Neonectria ditissima]
MASSFVLGALSLASFVNIASALEGSDKRGLCFVPNKEHPEDNKIWIQNGSDLTWYYNYGESPSSAFSDLSQEEFEFVPMMWGVGKNPTDTSFLKSVESLIESGTNITHVLGFNEPDAPSSWGGSDLDPETAAKAWVANFEPLGKMGIKLGLPAVTGGWDGLPWLEQFLGNCSEIVSKDTDTTTNCTWDFIPIHWYDNFEGLASHIGERRATWPEAEIWITEYAYANQDLQPTEDFFNQSASYFDRLSYVGRYTYFGAFRSYTSNVGPNAPFLNNDGELTTIGIEYLGINGTGVSPTGAAGLGVVVSKRLVLAGVLGVLAWVVF